MQAQPEVNSFFKIKMVCGVMLERRDWDNSQVLIKLVAGEVNLSTVCL